MRLLTPEYPLLYLTLFSLAAILFWIFAVVDILRNEFRGQNDKLIWILVVVFLPFLGTVLYFIIGRANRIKHNQS